MLLTSVSPMVNNIVRSGPLRSIINLNVLVEADRIMHNMPANGLTKSMSVGIIHFTATFLFRIEAEVFFVDRPVITVKFGPYASCSGQMCS